METECAELDADGVVLRVIVIEADMLATGHWGKPENFMLNDPKTMKNCAGVGYRFDKALGGYIQPKPDDKAVLDEKTCLWVMP